MNNIKRIQRQLAERGLDALLVTDGKNQRYALGFPFTDGAVLVGRAAAWLITDSRYIEAARAAVGDDAAVLLYDRENPCAALLRRCVREAGISRLAAEEDKLSHAAFLNYQKALGLELLPAGGLLSALRASKSPEELRAMRAAQAIAEGALEELLPLLRPGMTEGEAAAELVYRMLRRGAEGCSFEPIVVTGAKTSMPHGVPGDRVICSGDFVTMDFGCVKNGYCSDMTRTVAIGSASDQMKNVYALVLEAQLKGIAAARSGIPGSAVDQAARQVISQAGYGEFFGHGFGHSLGLDIHEDPRLSPAYDALIPENAVCSAEPGIYLPGRFGVRIEDVMILRLQGAELITAAPKELILLPVK